MNVQALESYLQPDYLKFPGNALAKMVTYKGVTGKVIEVEPNRKYFFISDSYNGKRHMFKTQEVWDAFPEIIQEQKDKALGKGPLFKTEKNAKEDVEDREYKGTIKKIEKSGKKIKSASVANLLGDYSNG